MDTRDWEWTIKVTGEAMREASHPDRDRSRPARLMLEAEFKGARQDLLDAASAIYYPPEPPKTRWQRVKGWAGSIRGVDSTPANQKEES